MTQYELLKANKTLVELMLHNGISPRDISNLEMYERYVSMRQRGDKVLYIIHVLSEDYGLNDRAIYRVIRRFENEVSL